MNRAMLVILVIVLMLPAQPARAQLSSASMGSSIISMNVTRTPVVGVSTSSLVVVHNPDDNPESVTVQWAYDDGSPLVNQLPTAAYNEETNVIDPGTNWTFSLPFVPDARHAGWAGIIARLQGVNEAADTPNITSRFLMFVAQPDLELHVDPTPVQGALDGGVGFFHFYVENLGNANDSPNVTWTQDPRFNVTVLSNFSWLPPSGTGDGLVLVRPLTSNETYNLTSTLIVNSTLDPGLTVNATMPPVHVNESLPFRNASFRVTPVLHAVQVVPHQPQWIPFTVTNTGDMDDVYNVTATLRAADSGVNVTLALAPPSTNLSLPQNATYVMGLHPHESASLRVRLEYNDSLGDGNDSINLLVRSANADLLAPRHPDEGPGVLQSTIVTPAEPDPAVVGIEGPLDAYPTDTGYYHVTVEDRGLLPTSPATVRFDIEDELHVAFTHDVVVPALAPGESRKLPVLAPLDALHGSFVIVARLLPDANATDADPGDDVATAPLYVRAPAVALDAPAQADIVPGARLTLTGGIDSVHVTNRGDRDETFVVTLSSEDASWVDRSWTLDVPSGVSVALPIDLTVPEVLGGPSFGVEIHAAIDGHPEYHADANLTLLADVTNPPDFGVISLQDGMARVPYTFDVPVGDALGVQRVNATFQRPDGHLDEITLDPGVGGAWRAAYTPPVAGRYQVDLLAVGEGDLPRTTSTTIPWTVQAPSYDGVAPVGFRNGTTIGNTTLQFADVDPGATRSLYVDVGEGPQLVPPPFTVDVAFWRDGPHEVRLNATSVDGTPWSRLLKVTLDRSAPGIAHATVEKDASGRILLAAVSPNATRMIARIETPNGPIDVPLSRTAMGDYRALIDAPSAWSSVEFQSWGDNGASSNVVVAASSSHALPLGLPLALVSIAIAALAWRRRPRS
jgi:hypothetical protein